MDRCQLKNDVKHRSKARLKAMIPHPPLKCKHSSKNFLKVKKRKVNKKESLSTLKKRKQLCKRLVEDVKTHAVCDVASMNDERQLNSSHTPSKNSEVATDILNTDDSSDNTSSKGNGKCIDRLYSDTVLPQGCSVVRVPLESVYSSAVLVTFQYNCESLKIYGQATFTTIKGACALNGFKLKSGVTSNVYAPLTHPAMTLQPLPNEEGLNIDIINSLNLNATMKDNIDACDVVVLIQPSSKEFDVKKYPGYPNIYKADMSEIKATRQLTETCWACNTNRHFKEEQYNAAIKQILSMSFDSGNNDSSTTALHPVVMTIGGKNAGKSTFNRYLMHRLLDRYEHVYYLECDVGQTEFTPSGIISVYCYKRTDGVLGPPFTHQLFPTYSCFYGNKTPADDPDRYIECIHFLLDLFRQNGCHTDGPLVINTMGWIRALGLQLLVDIARMVLPTHVIQFESQRSAQNLLPFTPHFLHTANGWTSVPEMLHPSGYKHIIVNGPTKYHESAKYLAPDFRNLALLSYLTKMVRHCLSFQDMQSRGKLLENLQRVRPYCVKLSNVVICNATDTPVKYKYAMAALNASLVGLCVLSDEDARAWKNPPQDNIIPPAKVCPCLGIGLVRGVDKSSDNAYVITDLSPDKLSTVNCLTYGYLAMPDTLILEQDKKKPSSCCPYVTKKYPYETIGANMFKVHRKFKQLTNT